MNLENVYAVIPSRNRPKMLTDLLLDLNENGLPPDRCIVVDNGDTYQEQIDLPLANFQRWYEPRNISAMWNYGITEARRLTWRRTDQGEHFTLVLNDDVRLPPGSIWRLLECLEDTRADIAHPDLSEQLRAGEYTLSTGIPEPKRNLYYRMTGWCFMMRGAAGFHADERFVWWCGDDDLEWRVRINGGGVARVGGTGAQHLDPDGWRRDYAGELLESAHEDMDRFKNKWGRPPWVQ